MTRNWKELKKRFDLSDKEVSEAVQLYLENNGPIKGLRFEQVNALLIMCDWGYISFEDTLEKIFQDVVEKLVSTSEEVIHDQ